MGFPKRMMEDQTAIQEAATQGIKSMEHLIRLMSHHQSSYHVDCSDLTDLTVSKFKKVISLLNRTGHARFRRGPVHSSPSSSSAPAAAPVNSTHTKTLTLTPIAPTTAVAPSPASYVQSQPHSLTLDFTKPSLFSGNVKSTELEFSKDSFCMSSNSSFMSSAITGDGSVSNGKQGGSSIFLAPQVPAVSAGKPPLAAQPYKKRCHDHREHSDDLSGKFSGSASGNSKCHCSKRRYVLSISRPAHFSKNISFKFLPRTFRRFLLVLKEKKLLMILLIYRLNWGLKTFCYLRNLAEF